MRVLALSSGTSVDAIDVAVAELQPAGDGVLTLVPHGHLELVWPQELRERLLAVLPPARVGVSEWCALEAEVGQAFGRAAATGLAELGPAELVASHGQTLYHDVAEGRVRGTLQIGQPGWIHRATGLPVVSDFRNADVAAGGQGAPLVSLLDQLWLGERPTAVLNIGGIANLTLVGAGSVRTGDTGPGNCLLDAAAQQIGRPADLDGELAAAGVVDEAALAVLLAEEYYSRPLPRTTGREYFHREYVADRLAAAGVPVPAGADLFATLTELTARTIADVLSGSGVQRVVASGGGLRNPVLMARLAELVGPVLTSAQCGLDADAKEAYLFALLGYLSVHGLPGTAPVDPAEPDGARATGAAGPTVLGSLTPPVGVPGVGGHPPVRRLVVAPG
ncbi:MAG TPA: anhydro-N-acetylmuramic acid kinase [Candidatus Ruania gallistercoris]|uniref:Anhydro-N-acetylmuramic acid kinase n=1 Tax=Candidatus Ruania gallistercoris TaxID=2838746 RepID=A0A9D2J433_9MICO|nr:anhydro-N-acetylmuramic acid kinase [Candidatus Ruania gallistercoris]